MNQAVLAETLLADPEQALRHARKVVGWMNQGVIASAENASLAIQAVKAFTQGELGDEADRQMSMASRTLKYIAQGVAPSQEFCGEAMQEIRRAIEVVSEGVSDQLRRVDRQR